MNLKTASRFLKIKLPLIGLLTATLGFLTVHADEFRQDFTITGSTTLSVSNVGWSGYLGNTATDVSNTISGGPSGSFLGIGGVVGNPGPGVGYLAAFNGQATAPLVFTAVQTGLNLTSPSTITWNMNGNNTTYSTVYLLVQVSGSSFWYATTATFSPNSNTTTANFNAATNIQSSFTFTTAAASWSAFDLNPGTSAGLGVVQTSDLSSNTITGIGFYISAPGTASSLTRIDGLSITYAPIPESSTYALLLGSASLAGLLVFRCRSH
ncbi:MAG: hypothetical protein WC205_08520 [Opitutaceae bacterium]|jgi:hypothetical protein